MLWRNSRASIFHFGFNDADSPGWTMKMRWEMYVDSLPKTFLSPTKDSLWTPETPNDMNLMFEIGWKSKRTLGQPITTYDQFRIAVGHYCRFSVAASLCSVHNMFKKGSIFALIATWAQCRPLSDISDSWSRRDGDVQSPRLNSPLWCVVPFFRLPENEKKLGQIFNHLRLLAINRPG